MSKRKNFFAQDNQSHPNHRAKYFYTKEEAEQWLKERGGGTIKRRNGGVVYVGGEPVPVWWEISHV